ncbi:MAG: GNAT family N-acetyltransferase [Gammaproteobacteria bacterium]
MLDELRIARLTGDALETHIPDLARLRIRVFRDFPYLYDGTPEYEERYLRTYIDSPESVIVLVFHGDQVVGASTAVPAEHETAAIQEPLKKHGYDPRRVLYLGESILLPEYRGRGLGVRFFQEREDHARSLERIDWTCFCAVERPADHPRRPTEYVPLDQFWTRRGYTKHPELRTTLSWKELDEPEESPKPMTFWLKRLTRP